MKKPSEGLDDSSTVLHNDGPAQPNLDGATLYGDGGPAGAEPPPDAATMLKEAVSSVPPPRPAAPQHTSPDMDGATLLRPGLAPPPIPGRQGAAAPAVKAPPAAAPQPRNRTLNDNPNASVSSPHHGSDSSPSYAGTTTTPKKKGGPPQPGTRIHHYELIRLLGKGGMGSVFLARDTRLGRRVAIKFLHTNNAEMTKRFVLEARTTARFSHENIVVLYEVDEYEGSPFMVLEYMQGQPLTKSIGKNQRMPPARAVELMVPVVRALAAAHAEGIVHRDLKFDNVFVTDSGSIKVLDFGIAKVLQSEQNNLDHVQETKPAADAVEVNLPREVPEGASEEEITNLTRHGAIMGTLAFMSPEQWGIGVPIDHRTDIWAVGIMLFQMLAGKHPLDPLKGEQLMVTGILDEPMPKLATAVPDVPPELAAAIDRCLLKHKDQRWPDALALLRALEPFLPGRYTRELKIDESPYAGLASFQESDAGRFFGRNQEIAAMVNKIHDQPLIGVVGQSGTGKSSFIRAGLVPALKRSGEAWETIVLRPGRNPLAAVSNVVAPLLGTSTSVADDMKEQKQLTEKIRNEPGYVGAVLRSRARREKKNILVFIDQFEELYTLVSDPAERKAFTQCLSGTADDATSPVRVVLSIRSDFLDRVSEDQGFMTELTQGLFFVNAPGRDGLRDAIVQPAEMAGYKFENSGMVEDMLNHLAHTSGALPLMQFAASKLWETRDPARRMLTQASYDALGGIAGALASHADSVLAEMAPARRNLARALFLRLVTPERTRAIVSTDELKELSKDPKEAQQLIDLLVQARLLAVTTGTGPGGSSVEIVHESLVHSWPTLKRWLDEGQEDSAFLEQLRNAAKQWQQKGEDAGLLWRGEVVEEARKFKLRFRGELPELQKRFLDEVFSLESRSVRRRRMMTVGGIGFLVALLAAASVALVVIQQSRSKAVEAAELAKTAEAQAKQAEKEARASEAEARQKEQERQKAALAAEEAAKRAEKAKVEVEKAKVDLEKNNAELVRAIDRAERLRKEAEQAKLEATSNAKHARDAKARAESAKNEVEQLLTRERERAQRLEAQLGSPVIDTLK